MTPAERQALIVRFWLPCIVSGLLAFILVVTVGDTPLVRAAGLGLVVVGMALALRRMGSAFAIIGGLTLCLSPAFWSQTGGSPGEPATIILSLGAAVVAVGLGVIISRRPYIALGIGVLVFVGFFFSQVGTPRSIRLTGFVTSWLLYLLIDMLLLTNPHPEDKAPPILLDQPVREGLSLVRPYHVYGILLLLGVGIINDPLLTLLVPAIGLALVLARVRLSWWYWALFGVIGLLGVRGIAVDYLEAQQHFLLLESWREAQRWLIQLRLVEAQFGLLGLGLAALGLARLARWYPPLGGVTLLAYSAYFLFGLVYIGPHKDILLLPLFIIQVLWMTYAVFTLTEWSKRAFIRRRALVELAMQGAYALVPLALFLSRLRL